MTTATKFDELVAEVKRCRKCARMENSERVLGYGCGTLEPKVMFIGEAPGRLGADASLMPFHGDKSGHNFEELLERAGLSRYDAFVTNAVLCNPKDEKGNNRPPTRQEIVNCAVFLHRQIALVDPPVVATLGSVALKACGLVSPHALDLAHDVRSAHTWHKRLLLPLYHPGQRARLHRSFANQLADFQFLRETVCRGKPRRPSARAKPSELVVAAVDHFTRSRENLSYFALHKLLFLAEVRHFETHGERLTNSYVVRQKEGPYFVELHPTKLANAGFELVKRGNRLLVVKQLGFGEEAHSQLSAEMRTTLDRVLTRYAGAAEADLKKAVYLTKPMRAVLRAERRQGVNLFNAPLLA